MDSKRKIAVFLLVLLIAGMGLALVLGGSNPARSNDKKDSNTKALIDILTVKSAKVDCVDVVNSTYGSTKAVDGKTYVVPNIGALKPVPPRKWSDAVTTPNKGDSPSDKLRYAQGSICQDMEHGSTVANFLANLSVDGVKIGDLNPWLSSYGGSADKVNDKAAAFVPLLDVAHPTSEQAKKAAQKNLEYQAFAAKLDTLLGRFSVAGVFSLPSVMNLHLVAGGLKVGGLPEVGVNHVQESLPALVLTVTLKGACAPAKVIGLNVGDMRPELFATPKCGSKPPTSPNCKSRGNCPTVPPCVSHCGHKPPPKCPKGSTLLLHRVCSHGKDQHQAAVPTGGPVIQCPKGYYLPRGGNSLSDCKPLSTLPTPPPGGGSGGNDAGHGDSGPGATNTTAPPKTTGPAPAPPQTSSPPTTVPTPNL